MSFSLFIVSLTGLSLGSFANVCAFRLPLGISLLRRSSCPVCKHTLRWFELIPIASFVLNRGQCRHCANHVSWQYPAIELIVASTMVIAYLHFGATQEFIAFSLYSLLMLLVAIVDWRHFIVPNRLVAVGLILGVVLKILFAPSSMLSALSSSLFVVATLFLIRCAGNLLFKKESMGMGDVKLAAVIGLFLGFSGFLISLWLASVLGLLYAMYLKLGNTQHALQAKRNEMPPLHEVVDPSPSTRRGTEGDEVSKPTKIPFGSFLAITSVLVYFFTDELDRLIWNFSFGIWNVRW